MSREYAPYCVFIQLQTKCQVDLLGNTGTSVSRLAAFHLDYGIDDLS